MTAAQLERLAILLEEMGEAQQVIGKILRHGYEATNPYDDSGATNRQLLEKEVGDVIFAIRLMYHRKDIDPKEVDIATEGKRERVKKFLHHQRTLP